MGRDVEVWARAFKCTIDHMPNSVILPQVVSRAGYGPNKQPIGWRPEWINRDISRPKQVYTSMDVFGKYYNLKRYHETQDDLIPARF